MNGEKGICTVALAHSKVDGVVFRITLPPPGPGREQIKVIGSDP